MDFLGIRRASRREMLFRNAEPKNKGRSYGAAKTSDKLRQCAHVKRTAIDVVIHELVHRKHIAQSRIMRTPVERRDTRTLLAIFHCLESGS